MHAPPALLLLLLLAWPLDDALLAVEDARADAGPLVEALSDPRTARQAVRAIGRFERPELARHVVRFLDAGPPELRVEAANALAQMGSSAGLRERLERERDPEVRGALYEALGRAPGGAQELLLPGLAESGAARRGAVKGLEHLLRVGGHRPIPPVLAALREVAARSRDETARKLALLALHRAGDRHEETLTSALRAAEPGVRRLAVRALGEWRDDPSGRVRFEALSVSPLDCGVIEKAVSDPDPHVALLAIDRLGEGCPPHVLETVLAEQKGWRRRAHAVLSLAKLEPERAHEHVRALLEHSVWQARLYAVRSAKLLDGAAVRDALAEDENPNVVAESLVTAEQAIEALESEHYGLLVAALELLRDHEVAASERGPLLDALKRLSSHRRHTSRDPRRLLLERLRSHGGPALASELAYLLSDLDPVIARLAAEIVGEATGRPVEAATVRFAPDPMPPEKALLALRGARAHIHMKEAGSFEIELLPEVAPLTAARFAELAGAGYYDGLTFHRVVPGFVIQGGSPGANEYVGTDGYLRDEVSTLSHERGTLGISTRGRDTGDSQIFVNLEDNYRLDHNYTVFARVVSGMENVDRILEGDVMERVEIVNDRR